jgi:hypothetical protein
MISAAFPYQKRRRVLGSEMAYVEVGKGDPGLHPNLPAFISRVCCCFAPGGAVE